MKNISRAPVGAVNAVAQFNKCREMWAILRRRDAELGPYFRKEVSLQKWKNAPHDREMAWEDSTFHEVCSRREFKEFLQAEKDVQKSAPLFWTALLGPVGLPYFLFWIGSVARMPNCLGLSEDEKAHKAEVLDQHRLDWGPHFQGNVREAFAMLTAPNTVYSNQFNKLFLDWDQPRPSYKWWLMWTRMAKDSQVLAEMCKPVMNFWLRMLDIPVWGKTATFQKYAVLKWNKDIRRDDVLIKHEGGAAALSDEDLLDACVDRMLTFRDEGCNRDELEWRLNDWFSFIAHDPPAYLVMIYQMQTFAEPNCRDHTAEDADGWFKECDELMEAGVPEWVQERMAYSTAIKIVEAERGYTGKPIPGNGRQNTIIKPMHGFKKGTTYPGPYGPMSRNSWQITDKVEPEPNFYEGINEPQGGGHATEALDREIYKDGNWPKCKDF